MDHFPTYDELHFGRDFCNLMIQSAAGHVRDLLDQGVDPADIPVFLFDFAQHVGEMPVDELEEIMTRTLRRHAS